MSKGFESKKTWALTNMKCILDESLQDYTKSSQRKQNLNKKLNTTNEEGYRLVP